MVRSCNPFFVIFGLIVFLQQVKPGTSSLVRWLTVISSSLSEIDFLRNQCASESRDLFNVRQITDSISETVQTTR